MSTCQLHIDQRYRIHDVGLKHYIDWPAGFPIRPFWRLYWNSRAGGQWESQGKTWQPDRHSLILIPPNVPVQRKLTRPLKHGYLHFSLGMPLDLCRDQVHMIRTLPDMPAVFGRILQEQCTQTSTFSITSLIGHALSQLPVDSWPLIPKDTRIVAMMSYMQANTHRLIPNSELARQCHLSEAGMIRRFTQLLGISPQAFFADLRLDEAARQLRQQQHQSIEQIADATGFYDRSHFSKRFTLRFGISPVEYRNAP